MSFWGIADKYNGEAITRNYIYFIQQLHRITMLTSALGPSDIEASLWATLYNSLEVKAHEVIHLSCLSPLGSFPTVVIHL